jgi:hypothetical protein
VDDLVRCQDEEGQGLEAILNWLMSCHVCMFIMIATAQGGGNRPAGQRLHGHLTRWSHGLRKWDDAAAR